MIPSLGIIITEKCNFNCVYCPPNGENIYASDKLCEITSLINLITVAKKHSVRVIRFTGGEPLLSSVSDRTRTLVEHACNLDFEKVILNTNATYLKENLNWLRPIKDKFLLKISLDTLNPNTFHKITNKPFSDLQKILDNIESAINFNFNIEINTVANKYNIDELNFIVNYCIENNLNLKIFDVFDFGNKVKEHKINYVSLDDFIDRLQQELKSLGNERLPGNRGLAMVKFQLTNDRHLLVVCHEGKYSSSKFFTKDCKSCFFYPCKTGKFQIPIHNDGKMSTCRLNSKNSVNISGLNYDEIERNFKKILDTFSDSVQI